MSEVTSSVETIEGKAEKVLEEARNKANAILLQAKEGAAQLLAAEMKTDEVKGENARIIAAAKKEATKRVEAAKKEASLIRSEASKKVAKNAERIVSIITGVKP